MARKRDGNHQQRKAVYTGLTPEQRKRWLKQFNAECERYDTACAGLVRLIRKDERAGR